MQTNFDPLTQYCSVRRNLEERGNNLVGRLAALTDRLLRITGRDHTGFMAIKDECANVRSEIVEARRDLNAHRLDHRC